MTKDELNEKIIDWNIESETIILEPQEYFNKGLIGVTEDKCHLIYSYQKITHGNACDEFMKKESDDERSFEDFLQEASEWVDYNTIRSLQYMNEKYRPIIIYEF